MIFDYPVIYMEITPHEEELRCPVAGVQHPAPALLNPLWHNGFRRLELLVA
jgi:hypothetical protein